VRGTLLVQFAGLVAQVPCWPLVTEALIMYVEAEPPV
jgi:hypothetical protein